MRFIYICYAYLFGSLFSLPNFWSFIFFSMLFLAELSAVVSNSLSTGLILLELINAKADRLLQIIQMMTVLTAIFDEFEKLRMRKSIITAGSVFVMLLTSMYFCTKVNTAPFPISRYRCLPNSIISNTHNLLEKIIK